jgi:gliding motility-associated-like protein
VGSGFVVLAVTGGKAPYIFQMNGISQGTDTFRGLSPGTYTAVVRDANGCEGTSTFVIAPSTTISVDLIADHEVVLAGQEVKLFANETSDTTVTSFSWIPNDSLDFTACGTPTLCKTPSAFPRQTQTYVVTVTNARGCSASDTVRVEVSNDMSAFFPAAFTPNGDGLNDRFEFDILGSTNNDIQIWNRWGEKVYSNPTQQNGIHQGGANGWDGTFRGKACEFGTYTYQIEVTYFDGHKETKAGTVILMK